MERAKTWRRRPRGRHFRRFVRPRRRRGSRWVEHRTGWLLSAFPQALVVVLRDDLRGAAAFLAMASLVERAARLASFERALVCRASQARLGGLRARGRVLGVRQGGVLIALGFLPRARWPAAFHRLAG